uniref:protein FAR1-RELATED SEQUENCE 1-like n=1 Tax=Erigeron canadensis TaxID=72917 RepID=UPI001CB8B59C|nr:protein FAR1-RELATED SEQUENCE 1-like [Erigeron canadensis]
MCSMWDWFTDGVPNMEPVEQILSVGPIKPTTNVEHLDQFQYIDVEQIPANTNQDILETEPFDQFQNIDVEDIDRLHANTNQEIPEVESFDQFQNIDVEDITRIPANTNQDIPEVGMKFDSEEQLSVFFYKYAYNTGFGVRKISTRKDGDKRYYKLACSRGGVHVPKNESNTRLSSKIDCKMKINVIVNDDEGHLRNVFWADARSRAAYKSFGDVVSFDSTYLTNKYSMPFAPFVGVNHHEHSILFGCGLLSAEDKETYEWLFKSWLECMDGSPPKAIITDQCRSMQAAVACVFPESHHRLCLWHIMKKVPEKLGGLRQYKEIKKILKIHVYESIDAQEFEDGLSKMIKDYNLENNEWLCSLYNDQKRWMPINVKKWFWAGMSTTQRSESMNAFFDSYVNSKMSLRQFVEQSWEKLNDDSSWVVDSNVTLISEDVHHVSSSTKKLLEPAQVRGKGRPPSKRKQSTLEKNVKKRRKKNVSDRNEDTNGKYAKTSVDGSSCMANYSFDLNK